MKKKYFRLFPISQFIQLLFNFISLNFISRFWAQNNPYWVGELNEIAPAKVMTWAGIINNEIIGPFFFDVHVNGETYLEMLTDFVVPELQNKGLDPADICYMHDGAPAHITNAVRTYLDENFSSWIGRGVGEMKILAWPPRSPDLNMIDFYLWGYLQHRVHMVGYDSIDELSNAIIEEVENIPQDTLVRTQEHLIKRLYACIQENGHLFEHKIK